jgi:hypothetical protein
VIVRAKSRGEIGGADTHVIDHAIFRICARTWAARSVMPRLSSTAN